MLSGDTDASANAINASGDVTGWSFGSGSTPEQQAFRYSGTTMTALGILNAWGSQHRRRDQCLRRGGRRVG